MSFAGDDHAAVSDTVLCVGVHRIPLSTTLSEPAPLFSDEWLASEVWPAAGKLISAMEHRPDLCSLIRAARLVVELGSGTGACGLAAAALGAARVLLTDQPSAVPLLQHNATTAENLGLRATIEVRPLCWRADWDPATSDDELPSVADLVLVSDCLNPVYGPTHASELAGTMFALLHRSPDALGLVAQTARGKCEAEAAFFTACRARGLVVRALEARAASTPPGGSTVCVELYEVRLLKRALSLAEEQSS